MNSNLKFSFKLVASMALLFMLSSNSYAIVKQTNSNQEKSEKPKKLTKEEKKAIKLAQAKAAVKNTKRVQKIKGSK